MVAKTEPTDDVPQAKPAAQTYSHAGAHLCMEEIIALLPKTKRLSALGAANELLIVLDNLWNFIVADLGPEEKKQAALEPTSKALRAFIDRHSPPMSEDDKRMLGQSILR